jgi:hypothetical protein
VANRISGNVGIPNLFADDGTENQNKDVDSLVKAGKIIRTIAQIDVEFSNSMVEGAPQAQESEVQDELNRHAQAA